MKISFLTSALLRCASPARSACATCAPMSTPTSSIPSTGASTYSTRWKDLEMSSMTSSIKATGPHWIWPSWDAPVEIKYLASARVLFVQLVAQQHAQLSVTIDTCSHRASACSFATSCAMSRQHGYKGFGQSYGLTSLPWPTMGIQKEQVSVKPVLNSWRPVLAQHGAPSTCNVDGDSTANPYKKLWKLLSTSILTKITLASRTICKDCALATVSIVGP